MSVLKDVGVVCHSVLVVLALRYLLQENKLIDCNETYCTSATNTQDGNGDSYREGFSPWVINEQAEQDKARCVCCKVSHQECCSGAFTLCASLHLVISVAVVVLKHKTFSSSKHVWIYTSLIIASLINTLLITHLTRSSTHQHAVVDHHDQKEGLLWKMFSMPFRLVWKTVASILAMVLYNIFMGIFGVVGLFRCYEETARAPVMFVCSLDKDSLFSLNMKQNAASVLSWTYIVSATVNIYSLMKNLGEEQREQLENKNNNSANYVQEKENKSGLRGEILAAKRRSRRIRNESDSDDSDHDSFVLGWRL